MVGHSTVSSRNETFFVFRRCKSRFAWYTLAMFFIASTIVATLATLQIAWTAKENILRQFQLEVYLQSSTTGAERDSVLYLIKRHAPAGTTFQYISPGEARERFIQEFGSDLLDLLGENPLPASYIVTLPKAQQNQAKMRELQKYAGDLSAVDEAVYEGELAGWVERRFGEAVPYVLGVGIAITIILMIISAFIVRSAVVRSVETANILLMLGASPGYFRRPYHRLTALLAGFAGVIAVLCGWIAVMWLSQQWSSLTFSLPITTAFVPVVFFFAGGALGWFATRGVGKSLKHSHRASRT